MESDDQIMKPQKYNKSLEEDIILINFNNPLVWRTTHPYIDDIMEWLPHPGFCNIKNRKGIKTNKITKVYDEEEFEDMIRHLQYKREWAVDLEHYDGSYLGIVCLIQISTDKKNFLIDPFDLRQKIKDDLKPLMESGYHVKIFHGSHNDLRWLQRDFGIYAWPVVDTQIVYRKVAGHKNYEDKTTNISLVNLVRKYLPEIELAKDDTLQDFRVRPLPTYLVNYAMQDTMYLLPILRELKKDLELAIGPEFFQIVLISSVQLISRKAFYKKKEYDSASECIKVYERLYSREKSKAVIAFECLHAWRSDKAKILDEQPLNVVPTYSLFCLSENVGRLTYEQVKDQLPRHTTDMDISKLVEILNTIRYKGLSLRKALRSCPFCKEYSHPVSFWQGRKIMCTKPEKLFMRDWSARDSFSVGFGSTGIEDGSDHCFTAEEVVLHNIKLLIKMQKQVANDKYRNSKCSTVNQYSFTWSEVKSFIEFVKSCIMQIKQLLTCSICKELIKEAVVVACECNRHPALCRICCTSKFYCPICWIIHNPNVIKIEPVDMILEECEIALKKFRGNNELKLFNAMMDFLRNVESELMCAQCLQPLKKAMVVGNEVVEGVWSSVQCCRGCDELFIGRYLPYGRIPLKQRISLSFKTFDSVREEINTVFDLIASCCTKERSQLKKNYAVRAVPEKAPSKVCVKLGEANHSKLRSDYYVKKQTLPNVPLEYPTPECNGMDRNVSESPQVPNFLLDACSLLGLIIMFIACLTVLFSNKQS